LPSIAARRVRGGAKCNQPNRDITPTGAMPAHRHERTPYETGGAEANPEGDLTVTETTPRSIGR
jgi:hypothetical protein